MAEGTIIRALSGFYDVEDAGTVFRCRAKGRFRHDGSSPFVGDRVDYSVLSGQTGVINAILPRKNCFIRPAVANIEMMVFVATGISPVTDPFLIDRVSVIAANAGCEFVVCLNKFDLEQAEVLYETYRKAKIPVIRTSALTGEGVDELRSLLSGKICAFTGNSGVGKSSLLNALIPGLCIETAEISEKLGRGRHTTRHVEFYALNDTTLIADTPGFASFEIEMIDHIEEETLQHCFPDFEPFLGKCRFHDCRHINEPLCAVLKAVKEGEIPVSRHTSYCRLYEIISSHRQWN